MLGSVEVAVLALAVVVAWAEAVDLGASAYSPTGHAHQHLGDRIGSLQKAKGGADSSPSSMKRL